MWARLLGGVIVIAAVVAEVGSGPLIRGVRAIDLPSIAAAAGITVLTTACCAWRWRLVAQGLGIGLSARAAIAAYYRSQFLNTILPGGVLGDVHRGVHYGRDVCDVGRGLRSVLWDRIAGQLVQLILAVILLSVLPSPVQPFMWIAALAVTLAAISALALARTSAQHGPAFWARAVRTSAADLRGIPGKAWLGIALASSAAVGGYAAIFLIAAHSVGSAASAVHLLPLAMLVLTAAAVPMNIAGFGPREGIAAWAFSAAGLGAGQGAATAAVYGILVWVSCSPGAAILLLDWLGRESGVPRP